MTTTETKPATRKVPVLTLSAMVVGSMVGAGVFSLPRNFAAATGVYGALIAWAIAGAGMLTLAFVFQRLAVQKPELNAGVYSYAKAGFGDFMGFFSALGYWSSACIGNVAYWVLIKSTIGALWPVFGEGNTLAAVGVSSVFLWGFYLLIRRGVEEAAGINTIVTIAKLVPILVFVLIVIFAFDIQAFADNLWGGEQPTASVLFEQVKSTMLITVFVFLGVEGASVYSRYARRREDVGRATVLGLLSVLAIFATVTILSYGILPRAELAALREPSMAGVLEAAVGGWGAWFISIGLIVSVLGAYLAWTLMAAEVLYVAASAKDMPAFLARTNDKNVPVNALLLTTLLTQTVLLITLFSEDAFGFTLELTSAVSLIPYLLTAAYALKLVLRPEPGSNSRGAQLWIPLVATVYTVFLLFAAGPKYLLLMFIIYAPGLILIRTARREQGRAFATGPEWAIVAVTVAGAVIGVVALSTGLITI